MRLSLTLDLSQREREEKRVAVVFLPGNPGLNGPGLKTLGGCRRRLERGADGTAGGTRHPGRESLMIGFCFNLIICQGEENEISSR